MGYWCQNKFGTPWSVWGNTTSSREDCPTTWSIQVQCEKPSSQLLGLIVTSHWLGEVWIQIQNVSIIVPLFFVSLENRVCLSCGVQVTCAVWRVVMRIVAGVGDLVQKIGDGRTGHVLGGRAIERLSGAVCGLHRACGDEECGFLSWASKPRSTICEWFGLKTGGSGLLVWASKPTALVLWFGSQNHRGGFLVWTSKISRLWFVGCATKPTEGGRCETHVEIWRLTSPGSKSC
jgi:hypothetical protein